MDRGRVWKHVGQLFHERSIRALRIACRKYGGKLMQLCDPSEGKNIATELIQADVLYTKHGAGLVTDQKHP